MSTKVTRKSRRRDGNRPGFHLYEDVLDSLGMGKGDLESPVYLTLEVGAELHTCDGGASVTVELRRELALALGLLQGRP